MGGNERAYASATGPVLDLLIHMAMLNNFRLFGNDRAFEEPYYIFDLLTDFGRMSTAWLSQ